MSGLLLYFRALCFGVVRLFGCGVVVVLMMATSMLVCCFLLGCVILFCEFILTFNQKTFLRLSPSQKTNKQTSRRQRSKIRWRSHETPQMMFVPPVKKIPLAFQRLPTTTYPLSSASHKFNSDGTISLMTIGSVALVGSTVVRYGSIFREMSVVLICGTASTSNISSSATTFKCRTATPTKSSTSSITGIFDTTLGSLRE